MTHLTITKDFGPAKRRKIVQSAIAGCWGDDEAAINTLPSDAAWKSHPSIQDANAQVRMIPLNFSYVGNAVDAIDCREMI